MNKYFYLLLFCTQGLMSNKGELVKKFFKQRAPASSPEFIGKIKNSYYFVVNNEPNITSYLLVDNEPHLTPNPRVKAHYTLPPQKVITLIQETDNDFVITEELHAYVIDKKRNGTQTLQTDRGLFYLPARMFTAAPTFTDQFGQTQEVILYESKVSNFPWYPQE